MDAERDLMVNDHHPHDLTEGLDTDLIYGLMIELVGMRLLFGWEAGHYLLSGIQIFTLLQMEG